MEGSLPPSGMMQGSSYGMLDLQNPMHMHTQSFSHQHNQNQTNIQHQCSLIPARQMNDYFPQTMNSAELSMMGKNCTSDEDDPSLTNDDEHNNHNESAKGKQGWHRMKWTDQMVRLLVTAVSYVGEDAECNIVGRKKFALLQKKGKWKAISKVLAERGCYVSPQQCEDKFNDLNKRYKRLTDMLGRGTTCKVVENPALLDMMDNISDKAKEDARKILSSKQLFYEEMCSYHNGNRFNLPPDPALQRSLQLALRSRDEPDNSSKKEMHDDDHDDEEVDSDDDHYHGATKRAKSSNEVMGFSVDMNKLKTEGSKSEFVDKEYIMARKMQLEEQRLQIEAERLEIKHQKFKWMRYSQKKDRELEKLKLDNKRMKLENERLALELRQKEVELNLS